MNAITQTQSQFKKTFKFPDALLRYAFLMLQTLTMFAGILRKSITEQGIQVFPQAYPTP